MARRVTRGESRSLSSSREKPIGRPCAPCYFCLMPTTLDPKELRPLLHKKLDELPDAELEAAHRALLQLEAERLAASVGEAVDRAVDAGKFDDLDASIREHRARHPYR